ncbi:Uncharacterised protein [Mycobacteroides abscessus subsp. massiliense]|nr:Uncharacterised protein [Mycobacteroides abscessus subsp. massiliense]
MAANGGIRQVHHGSQKPVARARVTALVYGPGQLAHGGEQRCVHLVKRGVRLGAKDVGAAQGKQQPGVLWMGACEGRHRE